MSKVTSIRKSQEPSPASFTIGKILECHIETIPAAAIQTPPYQRGIDGNHLAEITILTLIHILYTPIVVIQHKDGSYFVVDGQHRLRMALDAGVESIQVVLIYEKDLIKAGISEAMVCALFDRTTKHLRKRDQYKVLYYAHEAVTLRIEKVLGEFGLTALGSDKNPRTITAPSTLRMVFGTAATDFRYILSKDELNAGENRLRRIVKALMALKKKEGCKANQVVSGTLLGAFTWVFTKARTLPNPSDLAKALAGISPDYLTGCITGKDGDKKGVIGGGSRAAWAGRYLAQFINDEVGTIVVDVPMRLMAGVSLMTKDEDEHGKKAA